MPQLKKLSGHAGGEAFLLLFDNCGALFDTGFDFCADALAQKVEAELGGRPLEYILLTHSHYDHAGGAAALKDAFPRALLCAHEHAAYVFARPGAIETMRWLDGLAAEAAGEPKTDRIGEAEVDLVVGGGDSIATSGGEIQVVATPGHTQCSLSFYVPAFDLLVLSETTGVVADGIVQPAFIVSYESALESIDRCEKIGAGRLAVPHVGLLPPSEARDFFPCARQAAEQAADFVRDLNIQGKSQQEILGAYTARYYASRKTNLQPSEAFLLNTKAMIERLLA